VTVAIGKISGVQGFAFTLIEFEVTTNWVNLDTNGGFSIAIDQPVAAVSIAPDSDVDQAFIAFPNILLGATGSPPQQSMRCGVGAPVTGRINAQGALTNGSIVISTSDVSYLMFNAAAFFAAADVVSVPLLKLQIWWQPPTVIPARRVDYHSNDGEVTCDGLAQVIYRVGAWGRSKAYFTASGDDGVVFTVNGRNNVSNNGGTFSTIPLGTDTMASNIAEIGPIENKFFDVIEVTAQGIAGKKFRPCLRLAD
jgi:hypothetical protein